MHKACQAMSNTIIKVLRHLFPHSYQLIKQPFALESVSRLGYVGKSWVIRYRLWQRKGWRMHCLWEQAFFLSYKNADSFPSSGMSLAFNQEQHCTPDQAVHTRARAALCCCIIVISQIPISYMKYHAHSFVSCLHIWVIYDKLCKSKFQG